ncbi:MAG TPA: O-antigen ligase family protein [Flavipsychrobacter sp.]
MLKGKWLQIAMHALLCMLAFFVSYPYIFAAATIGLLMVIWLLQANFADIYKKLKERKWLWPWIGYFLLHAISYTYSANKSQSAFDLQSKFSLLILPIIIGAGVSFDKKKLETIFLSAILGSATIALFCIIQACIRVNGEGYFYYKFFFYHDLVYRLDANAVYVAWHTMLSLTALLLWPWQFYFNGSAKKWRVLLIILLTAFFLMLSARMLTVVFFIVLIPIYIVKIFRHARLTRMQIGATLAIFVIIAGLLVFTNNPIKKRYADIFQKDISKAWLKDYRNVPQKDFNNLTLRLMVWRMGFENINENNLWLTGSGNGDAQDLQNQKMAAYGIDVNNPDPNKRSEYFNLNMHNMWFQSLLMIGLPGMLLFMLITLPPLLYVRKIPFKYFFIVFHITALFFMFQEAALQTQAGVIYYTFFSSIFWNIYYSRKQLV